MRSIIFFLLFLTGPLLYAQDMNRVREHIAVLCDEDFSGRGYIFNGAEHAADWLAVKFEEAGLKPLSPESDQPFFQSFRLRVNTFPATPFLKIGHKKLRLGRDYILSPTSGSGKVKGEVIFIPDSLLEDTVALGQYCIATPFEGKVITFDGRYDPERYRWPSAGVKRLQEAAAIILLEDKLTFGVGRFQWGIPRAIVKRSIWEKHKGDDRKITLKVNAEMKDTEGYNVIGKIEGTSSSDSVIVFSAHYDHLGGIGKNVYFPGGNDNASGVAMLLEMAHWYRQHPPEMSVLLIAFGGEEAGLVGSRYFVDHPLYPLNKMRFLINMDLFGSGEEGMMAVNGSVFTKEYALLQQLNEEKQYLSEIKKRGKAANSDHYFFSEAGVPAFFFYLMGSSWQHYHDIYDDHRLPLSEFEDAFQLIIRFSDTLMQPQK
ncbi:M28 family metallopeptidase [Algivirga pacifica]|uniref:M28 family peptidase n=1 Tax=Algivirga pacifica TaxID=1162670 RepID=A0ABP9D6I7_9BACT